MESRKISSIISFDIPAGWDTAENKYLEAREELEYWDFDKSITETWPEQLNMWPRWQTTDNFAAIDLSCATWFYTNSELSTVESKLSGKDDFRFEDLKSALFEEWYLRDNATASEEYFDEECESETETTRRYYKITKLCRGLIQGRECAMIESEEIEGRLKKRTYHLIIDREKSTDADGAEGWNVLELHIMLWSTTENHDYLDKEFQQFIDSICWL